MSHEATITPVSFDGLSRASCEFTICSLPSATEAKCLIVKFDGEAGNSHALFGTFAYMRGMIAAGVAAWFPSAVVLDLVKLTYKWGDAMQGVIAGIGLPVAVVVSSRNREGLTSLIEEEMFDDPSQWLFNSLPDAIAACDRKYVAERKVLSPILPQLSHSPIFESLKHEWGDERGFLTLLREGAFDPAGFDRLISVLQQIDLGNAMSIDRQLVSLLWFLPLFMHWQIERVTGKGMNQTEYSSACNRIEGMIQGILGMP